MIGSQDGDEMWLLLSRVQSMEVVKFADDEGKQRTKIEVLDATILASEVGRVEHVTLLISHDSLFTYRYRYSRFHSRMVMTQTGTLRTEGVEIASTSTRPTKTPV